MKQSTFFFLCSSIVLGSLAVGIAGALIEKRKAKKRKPAATLRELYEDNAASDPSIFDISPESCFDTTCPDPFWLGCDLSDTLAYIDRG